MGANDKRHNLFADQVDTVVLKIGSVDKTSDINAIAGKEASANKDASGGYVGLTLFKINFKNVANTIISFFTNSNTVARTYTYQDRNGTIADDTDLTTTLNAAKAYADALVAGLWDDRGNYDASGNTYPASGGSGTAGAILKGDIWTISVTGTLNGKTVEVGDTVRALVDTPAQTNANWAVAETNIGYVAENSSNKNATGGYAGLSLFKIVIRNAANTVSNFFTNATTVARTWTFQDRDGTIADDTDLALKVPFQLVENTNILLPSTLSADGKYCGVESEFATLGETIAAGKAMYLKTADNKWYLTNNLDVAKSGNVKVRICAVSGVLNDVVPVIKSGKMRADAVFPNLSIGLAVYLNGTAGEISSGKPSSGILRIVGYGNTNDELDINIENNYSEKGIITLTDDSGASLSLSVISSNFRAIENVLHFSIDVSFPVTTDVNTVLLGGLPVATLANNSYAACGVLNATPSGLSGLSGTGGTQIYLLSNGVLVTNAQMSGLRVTITGSYIF